MIPYDHRTSIIAYMESQAEKFEANDQPESATALRATASSVKAGLDIEAGKRNIASPIIAIAIAIAKVFKVSTRELLAATPGMRSVQHARHALFWVGKKRLSLTNDSLGLEVGDRDPSTISNSVSRAEQLRAEDPEFKRITDNLVEQTFMCENCQTPLVSA